MKDKRLREFLGVKEGSLNLRFDVELYGRHVVRLHKTINLLLEHLGLEVENIPETPPIMIIKKRPKEKKP